MGDLLKILIKYVIDGMGYDKRCTLLKWGPGRPAFIMCIRVWGMVEVELIGS